MSRPRACRTDTCRAQSVGRFARPVRLGLLDQPAQQFTGLEGRYVSLKDTIAGFQEILSGALDHLPEQAFYLVGGIDDVKAKAAKLEKQAS